MVDDTSEMLHGVARGDVTLAKGRKGQPMETLLGIASRTLTETEMQRVLGTDYYKKFEKLLPELKELAARGIHETWYLDRLGKDLVIQDTSNLGSIPGLGRSHKDALSGEEGMKGWMTVAAQGFIDLASDSDLYVLEKAANAAIGLPQDYVKKFRRGHYAYEEGMRMVPFGGKYNEMYKYLKRREDVGIHSMQTKADEIGEYGAAIRDKRSKGKQV